MGTKAINNARYIRQVMYKKDMGDEQFCNELTRLGCTKDSMFVAPTDSGGGKAINYMKTHGFPYIYSISKPPGSVGLGIKELRSREVYYVMDNELDFEVGNYTYILDPNEEETSEPSDKHNHLLDAARYVELYRPYF